MLQDYFNKSVYEKCKECGEEYNISEKCPNCERLKKLKGIECPCCKGKDIHISQQKESNEIIGPGSASWVVFENFVCKKCGCMFIDAKQFKKIIIRRKNNGL